MEASLPRLIKPFNFTFTGDVTYENVQTFLRVHVYNHDIISQRRKIVGLKPPSFLSKLISTNQIFLSSLKINSASFPFDKVAIFNLTDKDYLQIAKDNHVDPQAKGFSKSFELTAFLLQDTDNENTMLLRTNHELIHLLSYCEIKFDDKNHGFVHEQQGYWCCQVNDNRWRLFNEAITQVVNIYQLKHLWSQNMLPNLVVALASGALQLAYLTETMIVIELIRTLAEKTNQPFDSLLGKIITGMFTGDKHVCDMFQNNFGTKIHDAIAKMPSFASLDEGMRFLDEIGFHDAVIRLQQSKSADFFTSFTGII